MEVAPKQPIKELTDAPADLGCAPPAVSITFNSPAVKADEAQAAEKPSKAAHAKVGLAAITRSGCMLDNLNDLGVLNPILRNILPSMKLHTE